MWCQFKKKIKQQKKNLCGTPIVLFKNFLKGGIQVSSKMQSCPRKNVFIRQIVKKPHRSNEREGDGRSSL